MKAGAPRLLFYGLALVLAWQALGLVNAVLRHPYPLEYGEGVNLLWSRRAAAGLPLYPEISGAELPQLHNPYPPLAPLLTALLHRLGADAHPFAAGRLLSLTGLVLSAAALFAIVRRRAGNGAAGIGLLLFLLSPMMQRFGPMMRVDSLALGFSLQALNLLDQRKMYSAALLAALAIGVKPSYAAAAITVALLSLSDRKPKQILITAGCGLLPLTLILFWMRFQPASDWTLHLFTLQQLPADFSALFGWLSRFAGGHGPVLTLAALSYRKTDKPLNLYVPALLFPLLITAWISGSQENYLMELWAAACILAACALPEIRDSRPRAAALFCLLQLMLFLPVAPAPVFTRTYGQEIPGGQSAVGRPGEQDVEIGRLLQAELRVMEGPVLSADLGHLLPAGHSPQYQPYQFEHLGAAGKWSSQALHTAIENGRFSAVLLKGLAEDAGDPTFTPETQTLIHEHYSLHRVLGPWHLYRSK